MNSVWIKDNSFAQIHLKLDVKFSDNTLINIFCENGSSTAWNRNLFSLLETIQTCKLLCLPIILLNTSSHAYKMLHLLLGGYTLWLERLSSEYLEKCMYCHQKITLMKMIRIISGKTIIACQQSRCSFSWLHW